MKHLILYGPGYSASLLVSDDAAQDVNATTLAIKTGIANEDVLVKGAQSWFLSMNDFDDIDKIQGV